LQDEEAKIANRVSNYFERQGQFNHSFTSLNFEHMQQKGGNDSFEVVKRKQKSLSKVNLTQKIASRML